MTSGIEGREEELWALLARRVRLCTGLDHSSVTAEKAQRILDSTLFTLALGEQALEEAEALAVGPPTLEALFALGRRRTEIKLRVCRALWRRVLDGAPSTSNRCYRDTLGPGMAAFFRYYDPEFSATELHITCDYPAWVPVEQRQGVAFIQTYLERVHRENQFCAYFSPGALRTLWRRAGPRANDVANLYGPVLTTALTCVLVGEDPLALSPSPAGVLALQARLRPLDRANVERLVQAALATLYLGVIRPQPTLIRYLEQSIPAVAADLYLAREGLGRLLGV